MRFCQLALMTLLLVPSTALTDDKAEQNEFDPLLGRWQAVAGVHDGEELDEEQLAEFTFYVARQDERPRAWLVLAPPLVPAKTPFGGLRCQFDAKTTPPKLLIPRSGGFHTTWSRGIYQLKDDQLTILLDLVPRTRMALGGDPRRHLPADFSLPRGKGFARLTLQRVPADDFD